MAKKKVTLAQKNKDTYDMYVKAFKYFGEEVKELKKPTPKSVKRIKKEWKELRKNLQAEGYADIPNVNQIAKEWDNRRSAPPPPTKPLQYGKDVLLHLKESISNIYKDTLSRSPHKNQQEFLNNHIIPKYLECMSMWDSLWQTAEEIGANGFDIVADAMVKHPDYDSIISDHQMTASECDVYLDMCIEFFTAVMTDVLVTIH